MQSEAINELAAALAKAQGEITGARRGTKNEFLNTRYADLASCWDAIRQQLSSNGLSVIQTLEIGPSVELTWWQKDKYGEANEMKATVATPIVTTTLAHQSGQWIRGQIQVTPLKGDPQSVGSAISYSRRYALAAIVGLAQIDDDAESAQGRKHSPLGDAPDLTEREKQDIDSFVNSFADALNADVEEDAMAETIARLAAEVKERQHIYVEVWRRLDSKQRSAIKKFLSKADKRR